MSGTAREAYKKGRKFASVIRQADFYKMTDTAESMKKYVGFGLRISLYKASYTTLQKITDAQGVFFLH